MLQIVRVKKYPCGYGRGEEGEDEEGEEEGEGGGGAGVEGGEEEGDVEDEIEDVAADKVRGCMQYLSTPLIEMQVSVIYNT